MATATGEVGNPVPIPLRGRELSCIEDDVRPFALELHDGRLYVGSVCNGEAGGVGSLAAYVYRFDPVAKAFSDTPVFEWTLDYARGVPGNGCGEGTWNAWTATDVYNTIRGHRCAYPQPWLTGLAFDRGELILGLRDRFGDQAGHAHPVGGEGVSAGDLVRACRGAPGTWVSEHDEGCSRGGAAEEYYSQERFFDGGNHQETRLGGLV